MKIVNTGTEIIMLLKNWCLFQLGHKYSHLHISENNIKFVNQSFIHKVQMFEAQVNICLFSVSFCALNMHNHIVALLEWFGLTLRKIIVFELSTYSLFQIFMLIFGTELK
jgi:hypothetical protein